MEFQNLRNAVIKEEEENFNKWLSKCETEEGLKETMKWFDKDYKNKAKEKMLKLLEKRKAQAINKELDKIGRIEQAPDFKGKLILTIEWKKSYMWGSNPKGFDNYGHETTSIGGCNYDKLSIATAELLNQNLSILKVMFALKDKELSNRKPTYKEQNGQETTEERGINHFLYGYGSGYSLLPHFEGGVGVSCHERIINKIGLHWEDITNTSNTDVFSIEAN